MKIEVARISFDDLRSYWIAVDHFQNPNKKFSEVVRRLGPYETSLTDPKRQSYGLFEKNRLIGVTHLVQWSADLVRYRTLNVRAPYRGQGLGAFLLAGAVDLDWRDWMVPGKHLFGWIKRGHHVWARAHGFRPYDGTWHDDHMAMIKPLDAFRSVAEPSDLQHSGKPRQGD